MKLRNRLFLLLFLILGVFLTTSAVLSFSGFDKNNFKNQKNLINFSNIQVNVINYFNDFLSIKPLDDSLVIEEVKFGKLVVYDNAVWPTDSKVLSSPFGSRLKASKNYLYDFHRGIDIPGKLGVDKVMAIADGEVFRTFFEGEKDNPYPNGGTVIILRHKLDKPFILDGNKYYTYYSLYMHLDSIAVRKVVKGGNYQKVIAGEKIGVIGQSGTTGFNHLHFEVRIGTACSYQGSCSKGYDPHVNPLMFLNYKNTNNIDIELINEEPLKVKVILDRNELDFNKIRVVLDGEVKEFNFNERVGMNLYNIDDNFVDGIKVLPYSFNTSTDKYEIEFWFDLKGYDSIEVLDIWGGGIKLTK